MQQKNINREQDQTQTIPNKKEGGDIKIGTFDSNGIFVGNIKVVGKEFDWSKLYSNLAYVWQKTTNQNYIIIIANFSTTDIILRRGEYGNQTEDIIEGGRIDWYSVGTYDAPITPVSIINGIGKKRILEMLSLRRNEEFPNSTSLYNKVVESQAYIEGVSGESFRYFALTLMVFNET